MEKCLVILSLALLPACGLHEPYVKGKGSLTGEDRIGFACKGQYHPSGEIYVREGADGSLYSSGVCPDSWNYAERKSKFVKTNPDLPKTPVILPNGAVVYP